MFWGASGIAAYIDHHARAHCPCIQNIKLASFLSRRVRQQMHIDFQENTVSEKHLNT